MTVCVGALCEHGSAIVIASDRMITAGPPMNMEFEHDRKKIEILNGQFAVMTAGNALISTDILGAVLANLTNRPTADVTQVGELLKDGYASVRHKAIEENVLRSINYNFQTFQTEGQKQMPIQIFGQVMANIQNYNIGAEFIVVGMVGKAGRIGFVHHPGAIVWYDRIGFHAIGSGAIHATMSLIGHSFASPLEEGLFRVYSAKKNAEVAPGVGT